MGTDWGRARRARSVPILLFVSRWLLGHPQRGDETGRPLPLRAVHVSNLWTNLLHCASLGQDVPRLWVIRVGSREDRGGNMSELPMPTATRLARPRWRDTRLILGLLLILVSVAVGAKLFAEVDERVGVWAVTRDLGAHTPLSQDDLVVRLVRLDETARRYVSADQHLDGLVLTRPVGRNELLPVAALSQRSTVDQRRVVIDVDRFSAVGLARGGVVDVYAVRAPKNGAAPPRPELVLPGVTVAQDVRSGNGSFGGGGSHTGVTLLVAHDDVATVIDAMAQGTVYLVQVPTRGNVRKSG